LNEDRTACRVHCDTNGPPERRPDERRLSIVGVARRYDLHRIHDAAENPPLTGNALAHRRMTCRVGGGAGVAYRLALEAAIDSLAQRRMHRYPS